MLTARLSTRPFFFQNSQILFSASTQPPLLGYYTHLKGLVTVMGHYTLAAHQQTTTATYFFVAILEIFAVVTLHVIFWAMIFLE